MRKKEKDMKFIPNFSLAGYSSKVKQHKEIVQQLSTMVYLTNSEVDYWLPVLLSLRAKEEIRAESW